MSSTTPFLISLEITFVVSAGVAALIRFSLINILTDLTGTRERAVFWAVFSSILLVLVPLTIGMFAYQERKETELFASVVLTLRWSMIGLVATLLAMGGTVIAFVTSLPSAERRPELQRRMESDQE